MNVTRASLVAWLAVVCPLAAGAAADEMVPTLGQPLSEVSHSVEISVADGVATYKVQRVFRNAGQVADEASLDIDLPFGGAVTGLRIKARETWYEGDLMEAGQAAALYKELTGRGAFPVKDPALLQWVWADKVHLQVFPVLPGRESTVEYTITVPTRWEHGHYLLSYPRFNGGPLARPAITVKPIPGVAEQRVRFDDTPVMIDTPVSLAPPAPTAGWDGVVDKDPQSGWALSRLEVKNGHGARVKKARVDVDITHTYKGDLRVQLVTPSKEVLTLHDRSGGSGNDVRDHYDVSFEDDTPVDGVWRLVVSDSAARDVGTINAWRLTLGGVVASASDTPLFIPDAPEGADDHGLVTITVNAPAVDTLAARLGRVIASAEHAFLRLELDLAAELRPLPRSAQVVFVVDASHSMGPDGIDGQLAIARAYLSHVPDASFDLVLYRRGAVSLGFAPAKDFDAVVAKARAAGKLDPGNGSALETGVARAAKDLHGRRGPGRIVVLGDALLRTTFTNDLATRALVSAPSGTIVHVVVTDAGNPDDEAQSTQEDDDPLAEIAKPSKGILVHLENPRGKGLDAVVLHLVRPTRIDHFRVTGVKVDDAALIPDTLPEGTGVRAMVPLETAPDAIALDGKIWGEDFHKEIKVDPKFSVATAGFVFSEHQYVHLDEHEQMTVAMTGHAVSPVTSYIAVEPGVRPSPIGLERTSARGSIGHGMGVGAGSASGYGFTRRPPDLQARVDAAARKCIARHRPPAGWSFGVHVETTRDEIVDVIPHGPARASTIDDCIVEAVWATRLDESYNRQRETFDLAFVE